MLYLFAYAAVRLMWEFLIKLPRIFFCASLKMVDALDSNFTCQYHLRSLRLQSKMAAKDPFILASDDLYPGYDNLKYSFSGEVRKRSKLTRSQSLHGNQSNKQQSIKGIEEYVIHSKGILFTIVLLYVNYILI